MRPRTALLVCLALALLHTWPIVSAPGRHSLNANADAQLNEWTLSWITRALTRDPRHLMDGNIFAPEPHTLTYTDPMLVPALMGAPVRWLGGSPVLTYNLVLIAGLTLTAWAGWLVARRWTGSDRAALVTGALIAFNVHLLTRLAHIVAAHLWGVPLAFYWADRTTERPRWREAAMLAVVVAAMAVTSAYSIALVGVVIAAAVAIAAATHRWRAAGVLLAATAAGLVLALPILWPYIRFAESGAMRPISSVADFSATLGGYLRSTTHMDAGWSARFSTGDVDVMFAGAGALVLAVIGLVGAVRDASSRRRALWLLAVGAAGVVLSLGPATDVYRILYAWLLPLRGLRAAARFGYLYLAAVAMAAGFGAAMIERRAARRAAGGLAVGLLLALVTVEAWSGPVPTTPFMQVPPIYRQLADVPAPVLLVEVPFYPPDAFFENATYVLNSTAHWRPLANGYSGFLPASYRRRAAAFWFFPRDWAIDAIEREGATHIMVHLERFTPAEVADIQTALRSRHDLQLIASDTLGHRLYRVIRPVPPAPAPAKSDRR